MSGATGRRGCQIRRVFVTAAGFFCALWVYRRAGSQCVRAGCASCEIVRLLLLSGKLVARSREMGHLSILRRRGGGLRWLGGWRQPAPSFVGVWWFLAVFSVCGFGPVALAMRTNAACSGKRGAAARESWSGAAVKARLGGRKMRFCVCQLRCQRGDLRAAAPKGGARNAAVWAWSVAENAGGCLSGCVARAARPCWQPVLRWVVPAARSSTPRRSLVRVHGSCVAPLNQFTI